MRVNGFQQRLASSAVPAPNPAQITLVHAAGNKRSQGFLIESRSVAIAEPLRGRECPDQALGCDQVANAEGGKNGARKRADVNHPSVPVQTLQRLERLAFVAELTVVIILH